MSQRTSKIELIRQHIISKGGSVYKYDIFKHFAFPNDPVIAPQNVDRQLRRLCADPQSGIQHPPKRDLFDDDYISYFRFVSQEIPQ